MNGVLSGTEAESEQVMSEAEKARMLQQLAGLDIVVGLVGPLGVDFKGVSRIVTQELKHYGFDCTVVRASKLFWDKKMLELFPIGENEGLFKENLSYASKIRKNMDRGDQLRSDAGMERIVALLVAANIRRNREKRLEHAIKLHRNNGEALHSSIPRGMAYVVRSLKRPEEVFALRQIYGSRFMFLGLSMSRDERRHALQDRGCSESEAVELLSRDKGQDSPFGQNTGDTFYLADYFLDAGKGDSTLRGEVERFLRLAFGSPFITPTREEHGMFLAYAASLRSGDLSRQVGAVVARADGSIVAEGANDAPASGGGQYWPEGNDQRDIAVGRDANSLAIQELATELASVLSDHVSSVGVSLQSEIVLECLSNKRSPLAGLTEFGRAVHAEMAAIMSCARNGTSTMSCTLYCTTYPCHNCAKHIVASGIAEVVYIEPYEKSRALQLHKDSISEHGVPGKVHFRPFSGVGPRRYVEFFSLRDGYGDRIKRKGSDGLILAWNPREAKPRFAQDSDFLAQITERELLGMKEVTDLVQKRQSSKS